MNITRIFNRKHFGWASRCVLVFLFSVLVLIRTAAGADLIDEIRNDTDPTKPVLFSLRNEYFNLKRNAWTNQTILRMDKLLIPRVRLPGGAKGAIARLDIPYATANNGLTSESGLGDIFGQFLIIPAMHKGFTIAYGSGLTIPTAEDKRLGYGKWLLSPAIVPAQFFPGRRGFAFIKFQDYFSLTGEEYRATVHQFRITPTVLYRFTRRFYGLADSESRTDWIKSRTDFTSGLTAGWMLSPRWGASLKVEIPWGEYRSGEWTVKSTIFHTRY